MEAEIREWTINISWLEVGVWIGPFDMHCTYRRHWDVGTGEGRWQWNTLREFNTWNGYVGKYAATMLDELVHAHPQISLLLANYGYE